MIHYHGLPITPTLAMLRAMQGRHAMVSFEHQQQLAEAVEVCQSVALDNGAFSAWRQGTPYNFDGYYEWCGHWLMIDRIEAHASARRWCASSSGVQQNMELLG